MEEGAVEGGRLAGLPSHDLQLVLARDCTTHRDSEPVGGRQRCMRPCSVPLLDGILILNSIGSPHPHPQAMDEEEPGTPSEAPSPQGSEDIRAGSGPSPARSGRPSLAPQFQTRAHGGPPPDEDAHGPDHDREERGFGSSPAAGAARARSTASSSGSCGGAGAAPSAPVSPSPAGAWRGAADLLAQDAELADVESWLMGAGPGSPDPGAASDPGRLARAAAEFAATWMPLSPAQHRGKAAGAAPASRRLELDRLAVPGKGGVHQGRGLGPVTPQQAQREVAARPASPGPSPASPGLRIAAHRPQGLRLAPTIASPIARREPRPAGEWCVCSQGAASGRGSGLHVAAACSSHAHACSARPMASCAGRAHPNWAPTTTSQAWPQRAHQARTQSPPRSPDRSRLLARRPGTVHRSPLWLQRPGSHALGGEGSIHRAGAQGETSQDLDIRPSGVYCSALSSFLSSPCHGSNLQFSPAIDGPHARK